MRLIRLDTSEWRVFLYNVRHGDSEAKKADQKPIKMWISSK